MKWVAHFSTPRCSSYWKGSFRVTLDYSRQLYLLIFKVFPLNIIIRHVLLLEILGLLYYIGEIKFFLVFVFSLVVNVKNLFYQFLVWSEQVLLILKSIDINQCFLQDGNKFIILMWPNVVFLRENYIHIYSHPQTSASFYQNSSVWLNSIFP